MLPEISIVVPVFHEKELLERLLRSIAIQSYISRSEIILADFDPDRRGSTRFVADKFYKEFEIPCKIVHIQEKGIASARNEAILESDGTIICNLDADNRFTHGKCLERLINPILYQEAVLTYTNVKNDYSEIKTEEEFKEIRKREIQLPLNTFFSFVAWLAPGMCVRKDVFFEVDGFPVNVDPFECVSFSSKVWWRYPFKLKFVKNADLLASPRRMLKEDKLGLVEGVLRRTTAIRGNEIIEGDYEEYYE